MASDWSSLLALYRQERTSQPQFYYNELAERGRATAHLRPLLANFLNSRIALDDFIRELARQSRQGVSAARGRSSGRYWRFNSAGRLFLESYLKLLQAGGLANAGNAALQSLLVAPANLDGAQRQLTAFTQFLTELQATSLSDQPSPIKTGLVPYIASYFWASQQPQQWPVYERTSREGLIRAGQMVIVEKDAAGQYSAFYLAFNRAVADLEVPGYWELESFLQWLARRELSAGRLLKSRPVSRKGLGELRDLLEPLVRAQVDENILAEVVESARLSMAEPGKPVQLELRLAESGPMLAGVHFEGFSPAALATELGAITLQELLGFLVARPQYQFYNARLEALPAPNLNDLVNEFWLLAPLVQDPKSAERLTENRPAERLVSEWRLLYPFACRLAAPYDEEAEFTSSENTPEPLDYLQKAADKEEIPLRAVADEPVAYNYATEAASEEVIAPPPPVVPNNEAANQETLRIARFRPTPLSSEQVAALIAYIKERLIISEEKITELVTHLEAGRNLLLYGPPGSGKTRLARLLSGQMCAPDPGWASENEATNYALTTATAEWSQYDTIGGIRPGLSGEGSGQNLFYYFEPGVVARAAAACEESLRRNGRPYYLIIDEFNRANQERAFGELFTLLEYRDRPLLPGARLGRAADLFIPDAFRIIGTLNADDRNTLFELGQALRRRFALVEIGLPPAAEERKFLPRAVKARLSSVLLTPGGDFADPALSGVADQLSQFVQVVRPDPAQPAAGGKEVGTAPLIESLLFCAVATNYYDLSDALEDAILANLLPQLEGSHVAVRRALAAVSPGGPLAHLERVRTALQRMSGYV